MKMDNDIIYKFKLLAKELQKDDRLIYLEQARKMNDMDQELQQLIGKFNLKQYEYRVEVVKADRDEDKIKALNDDIMQLYRDIMANDSMKEYNDCKNEVDRLEEHLKAIIHAAIEGNDPMIVELPEGGCVGDCSSCSGCVGF
jgi:hypothetical protein